MTTIRCRRDMGPTISILKILPLNPRRSFYIIWISIFMFANARRKCHFVVLISATTELGCCNDVDNATADIYILLNRKSRRKYKILINFAIGIPMLARTMSHWYQFDAVQLSGRWNSVAETTSANRCRIDHFTSPNLSYAIFISLRYSGRRRINIHLMQFCDLGEILWYGKFFWYEYIKELASWMLPCKIHIFSYFDVCQEFPISMKGLNCNPILIFSQMLWVLSITLIERETNMRMYCSQWQFDAEL